MNMEFRRMDDERITQLERDVSTLTERVSNWMTSTTDYRKSLCDKLDKIQVKIESLPCPQRMEHTKHIDFNLKALWAVTGGLILAIVAEWVRGHGKL